MNVVVVDASALAAIACGEPEGGAVARRLEGARVHAPTLLRFELANTAWKKTRADAAAAPQILRALGLVLDGRMEIAWHDVNHTDAVRLARETGLTAYDASYLWLAASLSADLVTLDRRLAAAGE
jgi:predicted nucleic acid-binding protein